MPLSAEGWQQAENTSRFLALRQIHAVYSSPLLRAKQTAEAIAQPHGLEVLCVEALMEVDVGQWEGLTWDEAQRRDPAACQAFLTDAGVHPYLGGENLQQVRDRVMPAIEHLLCTHLGRKIVIVAHNVVNRVYLASVLGLPVRAYRSITQDNCGISVLRWREGQARLITLNSVFHLTPDSASIPAV